MQEVYSSILPVVTEIAVFVITLKESKYTSIFNPSVNLLSVSSGRQKKIASKGYQTNHWLRVLSEKYCAFLSKRMFWHHCYTSSSTMTC